MTMMYILAYLSQFNDSVHSHFFWLCFSRWISHHEGWRGSGVQLRILSSHINFDLFTVAMFVRALKHHYASLLE